jgi:hypothetical protein
MDIELDSAFEAELISLLIAISMARDMEVNIYSDCKSALEVLKGKYKGSFLNMLSGWKLPLNCALSKVKRTRKNIERFRNGRMATKESGLLTK